ncbi:MAG: rRNA maturation RNase YbeY [Planctomycetes bacterium]|nr:rRNA maturation RNase YbeY [Planctomycetota bacterium]
MNSNSHHSLVTEVNWQPRHSWRAVRLLHRVAAHTASAEGFTHGRLSIVVVGATAMATLHRRFLGRPGPTDVLSFDLDTDRRRGFIEGEVVVCADVARRRAARRSRSLQAARAELALYVVHGILHLAGYDDQTPAGFRRMHAREDELLSELGLGAVFRGGV